MTLQTYVAHAGFNPSSFLNGLLGKKTILLTSESDDIPFDLKHFPHIIYGKRLTALREELTKRVEWHIAHPSQDSSSRIEIDLYSHGKPLTDAASFDFDYRSSAGFPVTVHNKSVNTFEPGSFKIGVIYPTVFRDDPYRSNPIELPDGRHMQMLQTFETLFPNSYASFEFKLGFNRDQLSEDESYPIIIRVFSSAGTRDFECLLTYRVDHDPASYFSEE